MRTVVYGTLEEWMNYKPDALLINRKNQGKYTSNGACITLPHRYETAIKSTYNSLCRPDNHSDYAPPFFLLVQVVPMLLKKSLTVLLTC